jgi:hypothetical protein
MPAPLTTAFLVAGSVLSVAVSDVAGCIVMGLALANQVFVEVAAFSALPKQGDGDGLG